MVIVDAFTHYVALNPVPHCNAYYAYTTLYEHWISKFGLPEIFLIVVVLLLWVFIKLQKDRVLIDLLPDFQGRHF